MVPLGDEASESSFRSFSETVLTYMQDRCMVCIKCTIGLEIFWTHPMEILGDVGHVESHLFLFGDSVSASVR
jgi:hypothetical protein